MRRERQELQGFSAWVVKTQYERGHVLKGQRLFIEEKAKAGQRSATGADGGVGRGGRRGRGGRGGGRGSADAAGKAGKIASERVLVLAAARRFGTFACPFCPLPPRFSSVFLIALL